MGTARDSDGALLFSGDLEGFGLFYDRYVRPMLAYFQRRVADPEVAADPTGETFAAANISRSRSRHGQHGRPSEASAVRS
jgi:RNA polymerase sigma-70 factor (ECF subfamily)